MRKNEKIAHDIYEAIKDCNIVTYTNCITRLRLTLTGFNGDHKSLLEDIDGVLQVIVDDDQVQVVLGPVVTSVRTEFDKIYATHCDGIDVASSTKAEYKGKQKSKMQTFLAKFSKIFVPLIPGFIAAGLLSGISSLIMTLGNPAPSSTLFEVATFLGMFQKIMTSIMLILIGHNTAKEFGGSGVNGAIISALYIFTFGEPQLGKISLGVSSLMGVKVAGDGGLLHGSVIGVLLSSILGAKLEGVIRRFVHPNLDLILTSSIALIVNGIITIFVIGTLSGYMFDFVSWLFVNLSTNPFGAAILAGIFLFTVVLGVHQGFIPVYAALLKKSGMNTLFPILAMAGAGQVGGAFALYLKSNDKKEKKAIMSAIIPGILGIGEPLIYGVTLPKFKPFVTSCLGGAVGGLFIGIMSWMGYGIGLNSMFGPSGIVALPLMVSKHGILLAMVVYFVGIIISYVSGFVFTYILLITKRGSDEN